MKYAIIIALFAFPAHAGNPEKCFWFDQVCQFVEATTPDGK